MAVDCVVRNGKLVIPKFGILEADIAIEGEKIAQIGRGLPEAGKVIDAKGKHVFPGCVDTHMHYGHFNEFYNEMESESKCMAFLGTTTTVVLLDRCIKNMEGWKERTGDGELFYAKGPGMVHHMWKASYKKIFPEVIEKSEENSTTDFAFHLLMENEDQINEMPYYHKELGISSFKFWTGLEGPAALTPAEMWMLFKKCKELGVLAYANTVNFGLQEQITREVEGRAKTDKRLTGPIGLKESRPGIVESLDLQTVLWLAKEVGLPELLICHVTYRDSVDLIRHYRRDYGLNVEGETCGAWVSLWWPEVGERLGFMATCIIPALGYKEDVDSMWDGIRTGDITCLGTDGVVSPRERYPDGKPNPYYQPPPTKERTGLGFPSHNCYFPVILHTGMERGFSPTEIAEVCAYNPARLMRLYPKKGTIAVGSDADLVIMDIGTPHVVRKEELHTVSPFCPWEGWELRCWPVLTMLRGRVIFEDGILINEKTGKYIPRYPD